MLRYFLTFFSIHPTIPFALPITVKVRLIKSYMFSSLFFYCSAIWFPNEAETKSIEQLQSRVTKWITSSDTRERLMKSKLMPVRQFFEYLDLVLFNSLLNGKQNFEAWNSVSLKYDVGYCCCCCEFSVGY